MFTGEELQDFTPDEIRILNALDRATTIDDLNHYDKVLYTIWRQSGGDKQKTINILKRTVEHYLPNPKVLNDVDQFEHCFDWFVAKSNGGLEVEWES